MGELERAIIISGLEAVMAIDGFIFLSIDALIVYWMLSLILFGKSTEGELWMEASIDAKYTYFIPALSTNASTRFKFYLSCYKLHGMCLAILYVESFPPHCHAYYQIILKHNK